MQAVGYNTAKRRANVRAANLVVDLAQPHLDEFGICYGEITIRFGLLELELGDEIGSLQLLLPAQLAVELADVDLGAFQQDLLLGALQQQRLLVDAGDRLAGLHERAGFGDHRQLSGHASRDLHVVAAVNRTRYGYGWCDLGFSDGRDLHDGHSGLLGKRYTAHGERRDCQYGTKFRHRQ